MNITAICDKPNNEFTIHYIPFHDDKQVYDLEKTICLRLPSVGFSHYYKIVERLENDDGITVWLEPR